MKVLKRGMDIVLSLLAIIIFFPLFVLIAAAIKIDSPGSVFFRQKRLGKDGKIFTICKFRTMIEDAEHRGAGLFNYQNDFRVTRVGSVLRKTSMDEAAQLINILRGEMSIVGPRPPVTYEHGDFRSYPETWKKRFNMRPGVTGLAQISGRNELVWEEKIKLDEQYIELFEKYGVLIDLKIMFITVWKIFSMASTYEKPENTASDEEGEKTLTMCPIDDRLIWLNGQLMPIGDAKINVLAPTAQFGANVFEGIRCYWSEEKEQLFAFRLHEHYKRLKNSIKMFRMEDQYTIEQLKQALLDTVRANNFREDIAVRQTIFVDGFGNWSSVGPIGMFIAPIPKGRTYPGGKGIKCCISSWERISDKNLSPKIKVGANYINSRMAQLEAIQNGYDSAIFMNHQGKVCEGPGSCLFIVRDGNLITPPCTASVLESITRDTIIKIAKSELQMDTVEREIDRTELYICNEAFLCGSAMEIVPISEIDGILVGSEETCKIVPTLLNLYLDTVRGRIQKYSDWLTEIYASGE